MSLEADFRPIQWSLRDSWQRFAGKGNERLFYVPDSESCLSHNELLHRIGEKRFSTADGHFGIGNVLMNLRIIAKSRQGFGILADGYPGQVRLFDSVIEMLAHPENETKGHFFEAFEQGFRKEYKFLFEDNPSFFRNQLAEAFPAEEGYQHIRTLAKNGDLVSFHVDLFDQARIAEIADTLASSGRTLGTIYLTNLTYFLKGDRDFYRLERSEEDIEGFWSNLGAICNGDKTLVCDAQHEQQETVYSNYDRGFKDTDCRHYVQAGTLHQRYMSHMERRQAHKGRDIRSFDCL